MKEYLAERLLAKVMGWGSEKVADERSKVQAMSNFKYDDYQQFRPRMRFIESLALWLDQLEDREDREAAYKFILKKLIFFSDAEIKHFVAISFSDYIRPLLYKQVSEICQVSPYHVSNLSNNPYYLASRRKTLFLGLSDGAHIDIFRRANPELSHEQIFLSYDLSKEKRTSLLKKLNSDLSRIHSREVKNERFEALVLLDDFTGSGTSFLRQVEGEWDGKIVNIFEKYFSNITDVQLFDEDSRVHILFYIMTEQARDTLQERINLLPETYPVPTLQSICLIPDSTRVTEENIVRIFEKYFDNSVVTEHWDVASCTKPFLGYCECAVPIIMGHNTPNNSPPLLWFEENKRLYRGLFPRVSRHK